MSVGRKEGYNAVVDLNAQLKEKEAQFNYFRDELREYASNKNYYNLKNVIAIIMHIIIVTGVIMGLYCTISLSKRREFWNLNRAGDGNDKISAGMALLGRPLLVVSPLLLLLFLVAVRIGSKQGDERSLAALRGEYYTLSQQRKQVIENMQAKLELYRQATSAEFSEEAFAAMGQLCNIPALEDLNTEQKRSHVWFSHQISLNSAKKTLEMQLASGVCQQQVLQLRE